MTLPPQLCLREIGRCIYCGSTNPPLSKEHIIPQGLNGVEYLKQASCEVCRQATHSFENTFLRQMTWPIRRHLGAGGRNKDQPEKLTTWSKDATGKAVRTEHRHDEVPTKAVMQVFDHVPEIFGGSWPESNPAKIAVLCDPDAPMPVDGPGLAFDNLAQIRTLAKIAHAKAVAIYGVDGFEPFLTGLVRGVDTRNWHRLVGAGDIETPPPDGQLVSLSVYPCKAEHTGLLLGRIRLFGIYGGPVYDVAIGRLPEARE